MLLLLGILNILGLAGCPHGLLGAVVHGAE